MKRLEKAPTREAITESIQQDIACRNEDLVGIVKLLNSIEGPYSLLLDAPWGDGKTFFVKSLVEVLNDLNPHIPCTSKSREDLTNATNKLEEVATPFLPFYFNAWENDFAEDPLSALFANMAVAFDKLEITKDNSLKDRLAEIADASLAVCHLPAIASKMMKAFSGKSLIEAYEKRANLRELIDKLAEEGIVEIANKLVIIIDELDRCRPDFAVHLLEQTNNLFQSENIIVIISTDSLQLAHAAAGLYGPGFNSQRFIERFFDLRLTLTPTDTCKVATGESLRTTTHQYDLLQEELINVHNLTIRDYARLHEKLMAGRNFCDTRDDNSLATTIAKCLFVPLIIFIEHHDIELFRKITRGVDFDALYEYGSRYRIFNEFLNQNVFTATTGRTWDGKTQVEEIVKREYVRNLCISLFAKNQHSQERFEAYSKIGSPRELNREVFTSLRFPEGCYPLDLKS